MQSLSKSPVRVRVRPSPQSSHTELSISLPLQREWTWLDLQHFCDLLTAYSGRSVRFVLPADGPCEWLDTWCEVLARAPAMRIEVQFVMEHRRRRQDCQVPLLR
jgi:hypothetical protein